MKKNINQLTSFILSCFRFSLKGSLTYHIWMCTLTIFIVIGLFLYIIQLKEGLGATGMNDYISWGLYISNFTFLVGMAAAAVMLVLPAYVFSDYDFYNAILIGEGVAVGSLIMCLAFVTADMGGAHRLWHLIPIIGVFNWPQSMLAWDVVVLNGYLALNTFIPFYIIFKKYKREIPNKNLYMPFVFLSIFWAFCIHLVTAFLYVGLTARPFWNNSLLGPRFLASAFAAGPSFILILLGIVDRKSPFIVGQNIIKKLSILVTVAAQINLIMLFSEIFKEFYNTTEHSISAVYLFFGIGKYNALVPWIWTSIILNLVCTIILTFHKFRNNDKILYPTCAFLFIAIWIEKGMGLIIPGFIPSPLGEIVEYVPTMLEIGITVGIWALGLFIITVLVRTGYAIEQGFITKE